VRHVPICLQRRPLEPEEPADPGLASDFFDSPLHRTHPPTHHHRYQKTRLDSTQNIILITETLFSHETPKQSASHCVFATLDPPPFQAIVGPSYQTRLDTMQRGEICPYGLCISDGRGGTFPSSSALPSFSHVHYIGERIVNASTSPRPRPPQNHHYPSDDDMMDIDTSDYYNPLTPPRSLTAKRGLKRAAEESPDEFQFQAQRLDDPQQPPTRRVAGMSAIIPHSIWAMTTNVFTGFLNLFRPAQQQTTETTKYQIEAVEVHASGRKRRAVDVSPTDTPQQTRALGGNSPDMLASRPPPANKAHEAGRDRVPSSFNRTTEKEISRRAKWHKEYYGSQTVRPRPQQPDASVAQSTNKAIPIRDQQVSALVARAHRATGGSYAQRAAKVKLQKEAAEKAAAEQAAAEAARIAAEEEEARIRAQEEEARIRAEEEAAQAQKIILTELPQPISTKLQNSLNNTSEDRDTMVQLGSIPLQKKTFKRILSSANGTDSWLDDDAVNAWFNSIVETKKRQENYVKSDSKPPPYANLQTAWWAKASSKEGPAGLKRWMKRAGVGGVNMLECERLFLPINMGSHWTLLIINGTNTSIEYLDSLHGDPTRFFNIARALLKSELGDQYNAQKWQDLKRTRSSKQSNYNDCGVFTCFNGLAAAKDKPYKEVTADKMPDARMMMAGVFVNGGFDGDFDL
jgi:sentrin-specific protease 1